jgi:acetylcholinesterase
MDSGSVSIIPPTLDTMHTNFTFVARHFGCDTSTPEKELSCMRSIDFQAIIEFVGGYGENKTFTEPSLSFWPTSDERIVFSNYTDRLINGRSSGLPALFTSCKEEGTGWGPVIVSLPSPSNPYGIWKVNDTITVQGTLGPFQCPAAMWSALRDAAGLKTYRWQYAGNFSNISPLPWMGAYHTADLPLLFGSHGDFRGPSTALEVATSESMQDHLLAFMKDPISGPETIGWADNKNGGFLRFGADGNAVANIDKKEVDGVCAQ